MNNTAITSGRLTVGKTYLFQNKADGSRSLNVWCSSTYPATNLSNVCLWETDTDDTAQQWILARADNNTNYVLKSVENSAKCLDLYTGTGDGANINAHLYSQSSTSYLIFENGEYSNTVRIRLAGTTKNGYYLTANQGSHGTRTGKGVNSNGNVYFYSTLLTDNSQEWEIIEIGSSSGGETGGNGQKLKLPINGVNIISASRTTDPNSSYADSYNGSFHYGADIACGNGTELKGLGSGTVVGKGYNAKEGNFISVKYQNCIPVDAGNNKDLIVRYFHMNSVSADIDDSVTTSTLLGKSGNTGAWSGGYHVHVEVDTDTEYPNYTPSLQNSNNNGGGLYKGTDSCENPFDWFFTYSGQSKSRYSGSDETWVFSEDMVEHYA